MRRITEFTSNDWGWWRTLTGNLDKLVGFLDHDIAAGELEFGRPAAFDARAQVLALRAAIDAAPKSTRWKLRVAGRAITCRGTRNPKRSATAPVRPRTVAQPPHGAFGRDL